MRQLPIALPRHAFSARDAARAGDLWRLFQEVAVEASSQVGWSPARYRERQCAYVMRSMIVTHAREAHYGEPITASTWVPRIRRGLFNTREIRAHAERGLIASTRQEWAHVATRVDPSGALILEPVRAADDLLAVFPEEGGPPDERSPELPEIATAWPEHAGARFQLTAWFTWMDPLDHVNHPAYVDFCDEAISRALARAGIAPMLLAPVAEEMTFKSAVAAGEEVTVLSIPRGLTARGDAVVAHRVLVGERTCASGTTVRRLFGAPDAAPLLDALRG